MLIQDPQPSGLFSSDKRCRNHHSSLINRAIDKALHDLSEENLRAVLDLSAPLKLTSIAERVRRCATVLTRRDGWHWKQILEARDRLMLAIYGNAAPRGWFCAWCDGSSIEMDQGSIAGIGAVLLNSEGKLVVEITQPAGELDPFAAEIAAVEAILRAAIDYGIEQIRVHTDCNGLVQLWLCDRDDPRLAPVRALVQAFRRFELFLVPRKHNQWADRLAKRAALSNSQIS
jgi:ribonuclease HI